MKKQNLKDIGYTKGNIGVVDIGEKCMIEYVCEEENIINKFYIKDDYVELYQNDKNFNGGLQCVQLTIEEIRAILETMEGMKK